MFSRCSCQILTGGGFPSNSLAAESEAIAHFYGFHSKHLGEDKAKHCGKTWTVGRVQMPLSNTNLLAVPRRLSHFSSAVVNGKINLLKDQKHQEEVTYCPQWPGVGTAASGSQPNVLLSIINVLKNVCEITQTHTHRESYAPDKMQNISISL